MFESDWLNSQFILGHSLCALITLWLPLEQQCHKTAASGLKNCLSFFTSKCKLSGQFAIVNVDLVFQELG